MSGSRNGRRAPDRVPLACRLERQKLGQLADESLLDLRLAWMEHFPLAEWFALHPERLHSLNQVFPAITPALSFGQAAAVLCRRVPREARDHPDPLTLAGMWLLLSPLLDIDRHLVKGRNGGDCYWGGR